MTNNTVNNQYDITIIGAGVIGCALARELSKYHVKVLLLEKDNDVSNGASKANSGIVHGGYDAKYGTSKGYFSRKGNRMFKQLDEELNFGYKEVGSLVLAYTEDQLDTLKQLMENGQRNGVEDLEIIYREQILEMEPHINKEVLYALHCPSAGITSPYEFTIALCENAITNGVTLKLKQEVTSIEKSNHGFTVRTSDEVYSTNYVINAAGYYSDHIARLIGLDDFSIMPRKGEYILLNKNQGHLANKVLFQTPSNQGKGILVTPTYHGNLMLGPNAQQVEDLNDIGTEMDILTYIVKTARKSIPDFDIKQTLTSFAGIRASSSSKDFIIEESSVPHFFNVAGIESPGLTSSPAIAQFVVGLLADSGLILKKDESFNPYRAAIIKKKNKDFDGMIDDKNPDKNIICRCEKVTESEIVDALTRGIPIDHVDGVKRRTRCTMGPCQGNFCVPRVTEVIAHTMNIPKEDVGLRGRGSVVLPPREDRTFWRSLE